MLVAPAAVYRVSIHDSIREEFDRDQIVLRGFCKARRPTSHGVGYQSLQTLLENGYTLGSLCRVRFDSRIYVVIDEDEAQAALVGLCYARCQTYLTHLVYDRNNTYVLWHNIAMSAWSLQSGVGVGGHEPPSYTDRALLAEAPIKFDVDIPPRRIRHIRYSRSTKGAFRVRLRLLSPCCDSQHNK